MTISPAQAINDAESAVTDELDAIVADLKALAERAKSGKDDAKRLTNLRERGEKVEKAIRVALEGIEGQGEARPPEVSNGEYVDTELAELARKRRAG